MLLYLASKGVVKEENLFEALTRQLLNKNSRLRPLFYELQGRLKRKPDALPHDAKRLAIGAVHT
jgi:hypothetical protein